MHNILCFAERKLESLRIRLSAKDLIFIACFPKSGSTYIANTLANILDREVHVCRDYNSYNINRKKFISLLEKPSITKDHFLCTPQDIRTLKQFSIRPVVLVRDIYDSIVSHYNMIMNNRKSYFVPIDDAFFEMNEYDQLELTTYYLAPWYINFFISWQRISQKLDTTFVSYEDFIKDKILFFNNILTHNGIHIAPEVISRHCDRKPDKIKDRFNKGIAGRGKELPADVKQIVQTIAAKFDHIDMSIIGITNK